MPIYRAENDFKKGLVAMMQRDYERAADHFQEAVDQERRRETDHRTCRALSYLALCRAEAEGKAEPWLAVCEKAVKHGSQEPDVYLNLGRLYEKAGKRGRAVESLYRGLRLCPDHPTLLNEYARLERRNVPLLAFLHRDHPVNCWLGRTRARLNKPVSGFAQGTDQVDRPVGG